MPTSILLGYNFLAFGSPWRMGYFYEVLDQFSTVHSSSNPLGIGRPDWSKLGELIWGERRGLIWFAPIVLLTVPGLVALMIRRAWLMAAVCSLTMIAVLLVNLSYPEWTGGWSTGPRLLLPLLPFAMLPIAGFLAVGGRGKTALAVVLAVVGGLIVLQFVAVGARGPAGHSPSLARGRLAALEWSETFAWLGIRQPLRSQPGDPRLAGSARRITELGRLDHHRSAGRLSGDDDRSDDPVRPRALGPRLDFAGPVKRSLRSGRSRAARPRWSRLSRESTRPCIQAGGRS